MKIFWHSMTMLWIFLNANLVFGCKQYDRNPDTMTPQKYAALCTDQKLLCVANSICKFKARNFLQAPAHQSRIDAVQDLEGQKSEEFAAHLNREQFEFIEYWKSPYVEVYGRPGSAPFQAAIDATPPTGDTVHKICAYVYDDLWQGYSHIISAPAASATCVVPQLSPSNNAEKRKLCAVWIKTAAAPDWAISMDDIDAAAREDPTCSFYKGNSGYRNIAGEDSIHAAFTKRNPDTEYYKTINSFWWGILSSAKYLYQATTIIAGTESELGIIDFLPEGWNVKLWHQKDEGGPHAISSIHTSYADKPVQFQTLEVPTAPFQQCPEPAPATPCTDGQPCLLSTLLCGDADPALKALKPVVDAIMHKLNEQGKSHFAFVKDFSSVIISYKYGGYFFDTNTGVDKNMEDNTKVASMLMNAAEGVYSPVFPTEGMKKKFVDGNAAIPAIEVNGMFVPPGLDVWKEYLKRLIPRTNTWLDENSAITPASAHRDAFKIFWYKSMVGFLQPLNYIVLRKDEEMSNLVPRQFNYWPTKLRGDRPRWILFEPVGLIKNYGNSWRKAVGSSNSDQTNDSSYSYVALILVVCGGFMFAFTLVTSKGNRATQYELLEDEL